MTRRVICAALGIPLTLETAMCRADEATVARLQPYVMQSNALLLSDRVTAGGVGGGVGVQYDFNQWLVGQADLSLRWLLGQSYSARIAVGYQHASTWAWAAWVNAGCSWGDRIEFLAADGSRPSPVLLTVGLRVSPLRFRTPSAFVSLLEPGLGIAPQGGVAYELTLLQLGGTL